MPSVVLAKIHARVQTGDLIAVAIELQGVAHRKFADSALFRLTPAGMVDVRIYVGIETVLLSRRLIPGGGRLFLDQPDTHYRLNTLVAVLPRHREPDGRAILIRKFFSIQAHHQQRERMHGFIQPQPFHVGEVDSGPSSPRHLLLVVVALERHVLCFGRRLHLLEQRVERKADPRNYHGPTFHATHPVNTLFERRNLEKGVVVESDRLGYFAIYLQRPGRGAEVPRVRRRIFFVAAELVEVVVVSDGVEGSGLLADAQWAFRNAGELVTG